MKGKILKLVIVLLILLLGFSFWKNNEVLSAEGDVWLSPNEISLDGGDDFNLEVHIDTGSKNLGAFNMFFDFDPNKIEVNLTQGNVETDNKKGLSKGLDAQNYTMMLNAGDVSNGHFRFAGMAASNYLHGGDKHLVTLHLKVKDNASSGSTSVSLRINELSDELGNALSLGSTSGANIIITANDNSHISIFSKIFKNVGKIVFKQSRQKIKLERKKTNYIKKRNISFQGKDKNLIGGRVELYVNGKKKKEVKVRSKYKGKWKIKFKAKKGSFKKYKLKFYDYYGREIKSKKYKIRIDTQDPVIRIPTFLSKRRGDIVYWTVQDNYKLKKTYLYFNGKKYKYKVKSPKKAEVRRQEFVIPLNINPGLYKMKIKSYDKAGNKTIKYVVIRVW